MDNKDKGNIIIFPDYEKLKNEIINSKEKLSKLFLELDELEFVICKNIEMKYLLEFGAIEYRIFEIYCNILRTKRKIDLIQAKINRQEKIDLTIIEEILDKEFQEYQEELDEKLNKMNSALERANLETLSKEETEELKIEYRKIVKALHPDLNPDISEQELMIFYKAIEAYKNGDLHTIRLISELVGDKDFTISETDSMTKLYEEKKRIDKLIKNVENKMDEIKSEFPYTMKDLIKDKDKIRERKEELNYILENYEEYLSFYERKLEGMI